MNDLHVRILNRVIELAGGAEKLAQRLKVSAFSIQLWSQGKANIPPEVVEKLVDWIVAADLASLIDAARLEQMKARPVLVVDDDPAGAYSLARVIQQLGYPVETAADGAAALQVARRIRPVVVFVDLRMPGMDGVQLAEQLRAEGVATHIVAATAYRTELERERTAAAGFVAQLMKPVERGTLESLFTKLH